MLEWLEAHQLPCWFRSITGMECPGCGFQRALLLLLKGEVKASFLAYPALIPLLFFLLIAVLNMSGMKKIKGAWIKSTGFACLAIILVSYLLKLTVKA